MEKLTTRRGYSGDRGSVLRAARFLIEPVAGAVIFCMWLAWAPPPTMDTVAVRSDGTVTSPYAVVIALSFAVALAFSRLSPAITIGIVSLAIAVQFLGWASRFSNIGWVAYLILAAVALALAVHSTGNIRKLAIVLALPLSVAISALLTVPELSLTGEYGIINGRHNLDDQSLADFGIWAFVALLIAFVAWRLPAWLRSLRPTPADNDEPSDGRQFAELAALSARERDIYLWVAEGMTNAEIAKAAHIEESTVKSHIARILTKLQLSSRTAVIAHAYRTGALVPEASSPLR